MSHVQVVKRSGSEGAKANLVVFLRETILEQYGGALFFYNNSNFLCFSPTYFARKKTGNSNCCKNGSNIIFPQVLLLLIRFFWQLTDAAQIWSTFEAKYPKRSSRNVNISFFLWFNFWKQGFMIFFIIRLYFGFLKNIWLSSALIFDTSKLPALFSVQKKHGKVWFIKICADPIRSNFVFPQDS